MVPYVFTLDTDSLTTIAVAGAGVLATTVIWALNQAGRISVHDQRFASNEKLADERHADLKADLVTIKTALGVKV